MAVRILGCGLTSLVFFPPFLLGILPCTSVSKFPSHVDASHRPGVRDTQDSLCQPALLLRVECEGSPEAPVLVPGVQQVALFRRPWSF